MSLIECEDVCVNYGAFVACEHISFSVNQGDYVCIVGANGSGKTTLVKAILGLVPITSGEIKTDKKNTGYLSQQNTIQRDFPANVLEVVLSGCISRGHLFYSKSDKENALARLKMLGIVELSAKPFSSLSGGQQQRVLLARAMIAAKKIIVLDEPVTGLDPLVTDELYSIIKKLNREENLSVLMVSHDVHRAVQNATHILHLNKSPVFFGTSADYQTTAFYREMGNVEVCTTHFSSCNDSNCGASHIFKAGGMR